MKTLDLFRHGVIEAHAGTGKTYTIVGLVLRLLRERGLRLSEILLVTYTEKAAGELLERIRKQLAEAVAEEQSPKVKLHLEACQKELGECLVGTIHGICLRLLRAYPFESGTPFTTELVDDDEGLETTLREVLRQGAWKPAAAPEGLFAEMVSSVSIGRHLEKAQALARLLLDPSVVLEPAGIEDAWALEDAGAREASFQARWAREAAKRWNDRKAAEGLLSFQDMLGKMASAVENDSFRQILRAKVRVGIIDEFQDTSRLQWSIFRTWFLTPDEFSRRRETNPVLYLVGDPKQSIYSFQGADVSTYLEACDRLETEHGAQSLPLLENWRSLPGLIEGYNQVLTPRQETRTRGKGKAKESFQVEVGWFLDDNSRLAYGPEVQARAPNREGVARNALPNCLSEVPVRLFHSDLASGPARMEYAKACAGWILALEGQAVDLPEGKDWKSHVLGWGDFAVVAGSRSTVRFFRKAFDRAGIPWALYKQEGVFASRAALELRAVLAALHAGPVESGAWRKALCTRVLDGQEDLLHALFEQGLRGRWAQLFRRMTAASGVQGRLLGAASGEREWMDWRQCTAHALDWLVAGKGNLAELVEHLGRLADGEENAQDDRNLHARATDRQRVQILTMHASKGLEFPVVFLAETSGSNQQAVLSWIEDGALHAMPSIKDPAKDSTTSWHVDLQVLKERAKAAKEQEKRRLHYVALTRPKLLLVSHCLAKPKKAGGWTCKDPLSAALAPLLDELPSRVGLLEEPPQVQVRSASGAEQAPRAAVHGIDEVASLELSSRLKVQTSYSQIQRESGGAIALDGRTARAEEPHESLGPQGASAPAADDWLPRGAHTGDALHEVLEAWMDPGQDLSWIAAGQEPPGGLEGVGKVLQSHGLPGGLAEPVVSLLRAVLTAEIDLGEDGSLRLCDLAPADRRPETEFHWAFGADGQNLSKGERPRGWMVGYIDLLFRHAGKWHVLDWKTTSLSDWNSRNLQESMESHGYALQADLYRNVVQKALPAGETVGRAVYLYLRAFAEPATAPSGVWTSPESVQGLMTPALHGWLQMRHSRGVRP